MTFQSIIKRKMKNNKAYITDLSQFLALQRKLMKKQKLKWKISKISQKLSKKSQTKKIIVKKNLIKTKILKIHRQIFYKLMILLAIKLISKISYQTNLILAKINQKINKKQI